MGSIITFAAALSSGALAITIILRERRSTASWLFFAGMIGLAVDNALTGMTLRAAAPDQALRWQNLDFIVKSILAAIWLCFSLTYSRGNYRDFLHKWRFVLGIVFLVPVTLSVGFQDQLLRLVPAPDSQPPWQLGFGPIGSILSVLFLLVVILVLMNLEMTFQTAVGTMRWRIKFVVLGLCVMFGAKIYVRSQALLYSNVNLSLASVESAALLVGCLLIAVSYVRSGLLEIDVYPSQTFLYGSITVLLAGIYLLTVGVLAHLVAAIGDDRAFSLKAFLILLGIVGLAVLLLSSRLRQGTQRFVSHHFKRPLYDYRKVWTLFTQKTANATSPASVCGATAKLISDTFNVLSVTIWLVDEPEHRLTLAASTSISTEEPPALNAAEEDLQTLATALQASPLPFDIDKTREHWAGLLRAGNPGSFRTGGSRICVPVVSGELTLGVIMLADRVSGVPFTLEEMELLRCIGNHVAASLLSMQLSEKLMQAKEQEAFKAVSAFFAHDLKNAASTLSLMLKNLPTHFEDPLFREDVQRGISKAVKHMNHLISRLSLLRQKPEIKPVAADLNEAVNGALGRWEALAEVDLIKGLQPLPRMLFDPEQIQNVVSNLVLNACDAIGGRGQIRIETARRNGWAVLTVSDDGCGMSREFQRQSLFRPFQTTKKGGTGIGMFQCKIIVEAHHGRIEVESEPGKGTSFHVLLPLSEARQAESRQVA